MRPRNGFTLTELILSMAVMSVIALSIAGLAAAMGDSYVTADGYYDAIQSGRSAMMRLEATVRKAKLITAVTGNSITFWAGDTNGDGQINLDEIKTVQLTGGGIVEVAVNFGNASNKAQLNVTVPLDSLKTVSGALTVQQASTYCTTTTLATGVTDFQVHVTPSAPLATRLDTQLTLGAGEQKLTLANTAMLRADSTAKVAQVGNAWVLSQ